MSGRGPAARALAAIVVVMLVGATPTTRGTANGRTGHETSRGELAFSCTGDICTIGLDDNGLRRLTDAKWINAYPTWSTDARRIAYTGLLLSRAVFVMNADGTGKHRLTPPGRNAAMPAWSPDGKTIAYDDDVSGAVAVMNADGTGRHLLLHRPSSLPSWSPDGTQLAWVATDGRRLALTAGEIWISAADGTHERRLATDGAFPTWSPDGARIAFLRTSRHSEARASVWVMNADGSCQRRIWTRSARGGGLSWSPDGTRLAVTSDGDIFTIGVEHGDARLVVLRGDAADPSYRPVH
jgi:Tol biopolymer transport system component